MISLMREGIIDIVVACRASIEEQLEGYSLKFPNQKNSDCVLIGRRPNIRTYVWGTKTMKPLVQTKRSSTWQPKKSTTNTTNCVYCWHNNKRNKQDFTWTMIVENYYLWMIAFSEVTRAFVNLQTNFLRNGRIMCPLSSLASRRSHFSSPLVSLRSPLFPLGSNTFGPKHIDVRTKKILP